MQQYRNRLVLWLRYDGNGFIVPSASQLRPLSDIKGPRDGIWRKAPISICCDPGSCFITFRNTTASANITSISTADGGISWIGTLANGDYYTFQIPNCYDETFTIVTSAFSGRTLTNTTEQGDGTISTIGALASVTNTFTTSADTGSQYLVILS